MPKLTKSERKALEVILAQYAEVKRKKG